MIGRPFDDPSVTKDRQSWPFKVVEADGNPKIEVEYLGATKQFTPQEISSMVLIKVRLRKPIHIEDIRLNFSFR